MPEFIDKATRAQTCRHKIDQCVRRAREAERNLQGPGAEKYRELRDEAIADARYWKTELEKTTHGPSTDRSVRRLFGERDNL